MNFFYITFSVSNSKRLRNYYTVVTFTKFAIF